MLPPPLAAPSLLLMGSPLFLAEFAGWDPLLRLACLRPLGSSFHSERCVLFAKALQRLSDLRFLPVWSRRA